ncbi:MAG: IMP dehydrogenase [Candidatus Aenigmarchaeota archaeon]|nr:IMP dehydrogenase [Candidatus Aenigmarchaeota archaeon]
MARNVIESPSRALSEYVILPGYTGKGTGPETVSMSAPLVAYREGEEPRIRLKRSLMSAAMQAVTGPALAIALAQQGGLGVIYCSQPIDAQAGMVRDVKRFKGGFVVPEVFSPESRIYEVIERRNRRGYSTFPVTEDGTPGGRLLGLVTKNDFDDEYHREKTVRERMIPAEGLYTVRELEVGGDLRAADRMLRESHHGSLIVVDDEGRLRYMVFKKDIRQHMDNPHEMVDGKKRYMVGAAFNTRDFTERVPEVMREEPDVLFTDTSQGFTKYVAEAVRYVKDHYDVPVIGGNVVTKEGFEFLAGLGVDGVKVGMGPGSICITIEQTGVGRGQGTAIGEVCRARDDFRSKNSRYVPVIADGGVVVAKDITVAYALGADAVMMGRYFVGCDESNSPIVSSRRQRRSVKLYWGEGSEKARAWREGRYNQSDFPEGVVSEVDLAGPLKEHMMETLYKVEGGMRKAGCMSIGELHEKAVLQVHSMLSVREAGAHDVAVVSDDDNPGDRK